MPHLNNSSMAFYKLRYEYTSPKLPPATPTAKPTLHTDKASEIQAKDELDSFLQNNCPAGKRLLLTSPPSAISALDEVMVVSPKGKRLLETNPFSALSAEDKIMVVSPEGKRPLESSPLSAGEEILIVSPEMARKVDETRTRPDQPIHQLDAGSFQGSTFKNALNQAKEIKVLHHDGKLVNSGDIQEDLNPFLEALRESYTSNQSQSLKKRPPKSKQRLAASDPGLSATPGKKSKPARHQSLEIPHTQGPKSDEELMFEFDDL